MAPVAVDAAATWERACLNCGTALNGPFCSECGQRAAPPHPSLRELIGDAFAEFSGWDGRFLTSLRALLFRPGRLTIEFIEGRRARYIAPLRLYLAASVVYFALSALLPGSTPARKVTPPQSATISSPAPATDPSILAQRENMEKQIAAAPPILRSIIRRTIADQTAFGNDVFNSLPKALFVLLPVFAGILKIFYPKRRYAEHLYFALHVHAFGFAALALGTLQRFAHSVLLTQATAVAILLGVPFYWHRALRRVYGGSLGMTLLKEAGVGVLYAIATIPVLIGLAMWVIATTP